MDGFIERVESVYERLVENCRSKLTEEKEKTLRIINQLEACDFITALNLYDENIQINLFDDEYHYVIMDACFSVLMKKITNPRMLKMALDNTRFKEINFLHNISRTDYEKCFADCCMTLIKVKDRHSFNRVMGVISSALNKPNIARGRVEAYQNIIALVEKRCKEQGTKIPN